MYSHEPEWQQKLKPLDRVSARKLKGRDQQVALAALQAGLRVFLQPYLIESCADQLWQLRYFPAPMALYKLSDRMDSGDLERALPIRASAEEDAVFGVTWIAPPPAFNFGVYEPVAMSAAAKRNPDPGHG